MSLIDDYHRRMRDDRDDLNSLTKPELLRRCKRATDAFWIVVFLWFVTTITILRCLGVI